MQARSIWCRVAVSARAGKERWCRSQFQLVQTRSIWCRVAVSARADKERWCRSQFQLVQARSDLVLPFMLVQTRSIVPCSLGSCRREALCPTI
ncbi:hypothetical protein FF1_014889 [Malus domestica]